ncbi:nuclear transport factor 2 family protein [Providencia sp. Me31A]|uniref:nuclear transport factor 2 family protein n=1 Tax=Providencia sp. Me31A TaxID=3392637 RepID=UPI003D2B96E8
MNTLIELEQKLHNSTDRHNRDLLKELLHEDFFEFGRSGFSTNKLDTLTSLVNETPKTIYSENFHCAQLSDNTVLITYTSFEQQGGEKTKLTNRSSIWLKNSANQWQLRFHQGTPANL